MASIGEHGRPAGGFTLVEMMVTVAVLAILTAIAAPSFT
ncbi:MAG: prepilin-type N-terminal cleavage/methylation domain-containing protein, partial [Pseudoxanthomonas sp.]